MNYVIVLCVIRLQSYYPTCIQLKSVDKRWGSEHSDFLNVSNGVKQGGVISPILFSCYIDKLFSQLEHSGLGCHVGASYAGAFGYADDIAPVAPFLQNLRKMISILVCEQYAKHTKYNF